MTLQSHLEQIRSGGRKALVPYLMAGIDDNWTQCVLAAAAAGADAIEVGIPFSDPMMDGVTIQEAGVRALQRGTTPGEVLDAVSRLDLDIPLVAMTYFNIFEHMGETAPERLRDSGFSGVIVPDLSFEEGEEWRSTCASVGLANIMMFAPSTPRERVTTLAQASTGFCYASARMAVTGAAEDIGEAPEVVKMIREATATPVLVGIGLTTPLLGAQAARISDGAIVGSALVRRTLDGVGPEGVEEFVGEFRRAIDEVSA